jgi:pimeloyl-ACP methyl ester carboxylesterase
MSISKPESKFATVNGIRLHYLDWGGDGPVLLLLTGMGSSAYIYKSFGARFADRYRVIALTRRGHGDSDYPETGYDAPTLVEDIRRFMDCLGIEKAVLAGHSIAGVELTLFAATYPARVEKMVYLDAMHDRRRILLVRDRSPLAEFSLPEDTFKPRSFEEYIAHFRESNPEFDSIWSPLWEEEFRHGVTANDEGTYIDRMPAHIEEQLNEHLVIEYVPRRVKAPIPVLAIYALTLHRPSPRYPAGVIARYEEFFREVYLPAKAQVFDDFKKRFPQARMLEIPGAHHYLFITHEDLVVEEMNKFLSTS